MVQKAPQSLDPDPSVILSLINKVVRGRWPEDPDQFNAYFATIGCTPGLLFEHQDDLPDSFRGSLLVPGVSMDNGSWAALAGKLHFLGFFFYPGTQDSRVLAGLAFDVVRASVTDAYGKATDESDQGEGNRSALWEVNETSIELYAHVNLAPMLQLGLSNRELAVFPDTLITDKRGY
ncbi:hypothetical protein D6T63_11155 [Arthrobacter cheniae]|uniref:Uncharacterized protein n=1 Tax=Arthrobacter cheniae TaxID=1258888 RepID=A0A3A5MCY8_9MICC|nr:hypothetical protein [Arthrobacter cheniae]RJT79169.1 hypothetical protein D6T63_11155 [Arthrobacter cheniae]